MADDINSKLRADIEAQRIVLLPATRGDHDLAGASVSPGLQADILADVAAVERRVKLLDAVIEWMDGANAAVQALQNDGWPDPPHQTPLPTDVMAELVAQKADLDAAFARFVPQPTIAVSATPTFTSQPPPDRPGP